MYSIELAFIIPIIVILIVTAMMMFQFATELGLFEVFHSRSFLLAISEPATINGNISTAQVTQTPYQVIRTQYRYNPEAFGLNAFESLNGLSRYDFNNRFYAFKNNRIAVSFVKTGYDHFLNMDR